MEWYGGFLGLAMFIGFLIGVSHRNPRASDPIKGDEK